MMADNKEQRVCVKFCFLLGKSGVETVLTLQEAYKDEAFSQKESTLKETRVVLSRTAINEP